jgi:hypothetical protein
MRMTFLALSVFYAGSALAQTGTANLNAYSRSLALNPTTAVNRIGTGSYQLYFSTSDSSRKLPLYSPETNGTIIVSSELSQNPGTTSFAADYSFWSGNYLVQYGKFTFPLSLADKDHNGIPDLNELGKTFYTNYKGKTVTHWPSTNSSSLEGRISRDAGASLGAYSGIMRSTILHYQFTGIVGQLWLQGTFAYQRAKTSHVDLVLVRSDQLGNLSTLEGSTTYTATADAAQLARTVLTNQAGLVYTIKSTTLLRKKDRYVGTFQFVDGAPETPWVDFKKWPVAIQDPTDSNGNGIPDLSDPAFK